MEEVRVNFSLKSASQNSLASGSSASSKLVNSKILASLKEKIRLLQRPPSAPARSSSVGFQNVVWKRPAAVLTPRVEAEAVNPWMPRPASDQGSSSSSGLRPAAASRSIEVFRVFYLFAGEQRKADVREELQALCDEKGLRLELSEVDLCRGAGQDMANEEDWQEVRRQLEAGHFDCVLLTPPCSTFSRAAWANKRGPRPLRSRAHPYGFPWLRGAQRDKAALGSLLVQRALEAASSAHKAGTAWLLENPEDLGRVPAGVPASLWQLEETFAVVAESEATTGALHQCQWPGVSVAKPTRLAGTIANLESLVRPGWPKFSVTGHYTGPLPRSCGHLHSPLIGGDGKGGFATGPSAAFPPAMCRALARLLLDDFLLRVNLEPKFTSPARGGELKSRSEVASEVAEDGEPDSEVDEDGVLKPPFGSGVLGFGRQLVVKVNGKERLFEDGAGLCSPGRWPPERRGTEESGFTWEVRAELMKVLAGAVEVKRVLYGLACGHYKSSPFPEEAVRQGRLRWLQVLRSYGSELACLEPPAGQPLLLQAVEEHLRLAGDPDHRVFFSSSRSFAKGVTIGLKGRMPRVPAVFDRRTRWRRYDEQSEAPHDKENYSSAKCQIAQIETQFRVEAELGAMREVEEEAARAEYGEDLLVAAIGAIDKGDTTFRVIHDGTHDVLVNPRIRARDQHRYPGAGELRRVNQLAEGHGVAFGLVGDVSRAHRLPRVMRQEWGLQACQLRPGTVWLNEVGTFGVGSAGYHWAREAAGLSRAVLSVMFREWLFQLLYSDDYAWIACGSSAHENLLLAVFFLVVMGVPLAWGKFRGGLTLDWVGYWTDLNLRLVGISAPRAAWLIRWAERILTEGAVHMGDFASVIGRWGFVLQVIDLLRPFLGPLYAWAAAVPRFAVLPLPAMVRLIVLFLKRMLKEGFRSLPCGSGADWVPEAFRADAKAEGEEVRIGGWELGPSGETATARWFSETLTRFNAPWVFESGEPFRVIAALELLATLCCVVAFSPEKMGSGTGSLTISGTTDNLGNKAVVARLMTTKFPLVAVLMELSAQLLKRGLALELNWAPRLQNLQADALTNADFRGFDPKLRVHVDVGGHAWIVLSEMLASGRALYDAVREGKLEQSVSLLSGMNAKRAKVSFKEREPWG